jgi:hypothetical protein
MPGQREETMKRIAYVLVTIAALIAQDVAPAQSGETAIPGFQARVSGTVCA